MFEREYQKVDGLISNWKQDHQLWIHLSGDDGSGSDQLIQRILSDNASRFPVILYLNTDLAPFSLRNQVRHIIKFAAANNPEQFENFLGQFSVKLQRIVTATLTEGRQEGLDDNNDDAWDYNLLYHYLEFAAAASPLIVVVKNIFQEQNEQLKKLLKTLQRNEQLPLILLSSAASDIQFAGNAGHRHNIAVGKRSVRETEKLVAAHLQVNTIAARLITNQVYVKSGGNQRKIRFMLEAFYRRLVSDSDADLASQLDARGQEIRSLPDDIFQHIIESLPENEMDALAFLARLQGPFPERIFLPLLESYQVSQASYTNWMESGFICSDQFLGETYVWIEWQLWKDYLKKHTSIERMKNIHADLREQVDPKDLSQPLALSALYFDIDDSLTALKFAREEAALFKKAGNYSAALERLAFLKRNLARFPHCGINREDALQEMGPVQLKAGLYENAFETFRELRDGFDRSRQQDWIAASLQMADALFKMDALSEAHYILKELKIKDDVPPYVLALSHILRGELEQNFGHAKYALRYYEKALKLLPDVQDEELVIRLYEILKDIYDGIGDRKQQQILSTEIAASLQPDSRYIPALKLTQIQHLIRQNEFETALELTWSLYRESERTMDLKIVAKSSIYLSEIYGYFSKWYLSRSHLQKLHETKILVANPRRQIQIMINLGSVEKELGYYHNALTLFEEAMALCRSQHLTRELYQVKVQLGHLQLLVRGFLRAHQYLKETLQWAEEHQEQELAILASLFLSSYEIQQNRRASVKRYLEKSKSLIELTENRVDRLNYYYYAASYGLMTGNLKETGNIVKEWSGEAKGITKFEHLAQWYNGKVMKETGDLNGARKELEAALTVSRQYRLPYLEFHISRDLADLATSQSNTADYEQYSAGMQAALQVFLERVGDEILRRQIVESNEFSEIVKKIRA